MNVIIQARMSSKRLPGKVLRLCAGREILLWIIERLRSAETIDSIVVATSVEPEDDSIFDFCESASVSCFRGSLNDVAGRMIQAAKHFKFDNFVRICGDSPLIDPRLLDKVTDLYQRNNPDLVTNVQLRTYPKGFSIEAIKTRALEHAYEIMLEHEKEHITQAFYRHPSRFKIINIESGADWGNIQLSVDTEEDFRIIELILKKEIESHVTMDVRDVVAERNNIIMNKQ